MRNRFVCIGTLLECAIQYYATHAKIRMALDVNGQTITIQQTISRKWAPDQLAALDHTIPYLHPQIKGMVTKEWQRADKYHAAKMPAAPPLGTGEIQRKGRESFF